jgi:amidophosphoribosyltransferase
MSTRREFVARDRSVEQVAEILGADHLLYQEVGEMLAGVSDAGEGERKFCDACFTGCYPTGDVTPRMLETIEDERLSASGTGS